MAVVVGCLHVGGRCAARWRFCRWIGGSPSAAPIKQPPPRRCAWASARPSRRPGADRRAGAGRGQCSAQEYDKFVNGTDEAKATQTRERLSTPPTTAACRCGRRRCDIYRHAEAARAPARAPTSSTTRTGTRTRAYVTDAHSLYLQSLAELGVGGRRADGASWSAASSSASRCASAAPTARSTRRCSRWCWRGRCTSPRLGLADAGGDTARLHPRGPRPGQTPRWQGRAARPARGTRTLVALGWLLVAVAPLLSASPTRVCSTPGASWSAANALAPSARRSRRCRSAAERPQAYAIVGVCDLQQGFAPPR